MRAIIPLAAAVLSATGSGQASAQDAPSSSFTIAGGAALTSDYRFRGISQTDRGIAAQATLTVDHASGFYVGTWASSIADDISQGAGAEVDLFGGYKKTIDGTTIDGGLLYYLHPGSGRPDPDFFEPYLTVSHILGPASVKGGVNFAWNQHGLAAIHARDGGFYLYGELSAAIPTTGLTLSGHVGHSFARNYITFDQVYTDWSLTASYSWRALTVSAAYVDTDKAFRSYPFGGGRRRRIGGAGAVGRVGVAF